MAAMRVKVLCRNPNDYMRETTRDIFKGKNHLFSIKIQTIDLII